MYSRDAEHLAHITAVILYLKRYMDENPVTYPHAMAVYTSVLFGTVPVIPVSNCDYDPDCAVTGQPCGGIADFCEILDQAMESLDLELDFEAPSYQYPASYEI